jgi:hypothetical protein
MKKYLFSILLLATFGSLFAQSAPKATPAAFDPKAPFTNTETVRIHLIFRSVNAFNYRLHTTLNRTKPIGLNPDSYTVLETEATAIGFFKNEQLDNQPLLLNFEKGKDYFFRITRNAPLTFLGITVDELTETAFKMELFANDIATKPTIVPLDDKMATRE